MGNLCLAGKEPEREDRQRLVDSKLCDVWVGTHPMQHRWHHRSVGGCVCITLYRVPPRCAGRIIMCTVFFSWAFSDTFIVCCAWSYVYMSSHRYGGHKVRYTANGKWQLFDCRWCNGTVGSDWCTGRAWAWVSTCVASPVLSNGPLDVIVLVDMESAERDTSMVFVVVVCVV